MGAGVQIGEFAQDKAMMGGGKGKGKFFFSKLDKMVEKSQTNFNGFFTRKKCNLSFWRQALPKNPPIKKKICWVGGGKFFDVKGNS